MNAVTERVQHLGIKGSSACIVMTNTEVVEAISQVVDVTQMSDAELWEAIILVNREVMDIRLDSAVQQALMHLSFGGSQVWLAKAGGYPCENCPDCFIDNDGSCRNEDRCTAWGIYSNLY
ncbi:hypothetical protein [Geotalea sp. SG265]|uniref:hypothetical protein n=1 Tax=Geotalea sp. SG265 TaxID=2922867 RepID=UPI001FAEC147|nr:hypothetical protein [Geotalea sp. SG265]